VTVLITIIAVFIAYNANSGLPFVPTYDLRVQLPSGGKLVKGNEVRVGGFRVGVVEQIKPTTVRTRNGERKAIALVDLKLDKTVKPLAVDSKVRTRPRSALGLKYVELVPGRSRRTYPAGGTIPLRNASEPLELEDVFDTFQSRTRQDIRVATEGFGDAFAGRGQSLNGAIEALNPFFRSLNPVMRTLADPETELDQLFRQLGRTAAQVAPVARTQALLFTNMATTFEAISRDPGALQATIEKGPPTQDAAIRSFRSQRPFLADFADLSRRLRPAVQELPRSLPAINRAFRVGTPVLPRTVRLNEDLRSATLELEDLFENPSTLLTLRDLRTALAVGRPALEHVAPYQTVCNHTVGFLNQLGVHFGAPLAPGTGTAERVLVKQANNPGQPNSIGTTESSRPYDVPANQDPQRAENAFGKLAALHAQDKHPAIDAQGNADCQLGQFGYLDHLATGGPYPPSNDPTRGGGNHVVVDPDTPGLAGGSYKARRLGINHIQDVP
jgi:virulence factor Mce-like protein